MWPTPMYRCGHCGKLVKGVHNVEIDGKKVLLCLRCFLSHTLHETIRDTLLSGREEEVKDVLRVLKGLNDLIDDNPRVQGTRHLIDSWAERYPRPLSLDDVAWPYTSKIETVVKYLVDEQIFRIAAGGQLEPGALLEKLLKLHATNRSFFTELVKVVTGLATVRFLVDPENPRLRSVYATLQSLAACLDEARSHYKVEGYRCKLCGAEFATMYEVENHILEKHSLEGGFEEHIGGDVRKYIEEVRSELVGYLCRWELFTQNAIAYGVHNITKHLMRLLKDGVLLPAKSDEAVVEKEGERYVVVDPSWIRFRERMRSLERKIVRQR
jgi:DNA-directed RNA polymerase subunit RPC12/RpoP